MGGNPVPLLVPCHRVVASDGIGGFGRRRDGVEVKRWLLTLEGVLAPTLEWNGP
jgi:methylated-DNA-[protein]-cysteine S-methyltransferase